MAATDRTMRPLVRSDLIILLFAICSCATAAEQGEHNCQELGYAVTKLSSCLFVSGQVPRLTFSFPCADLQGHRAVLLATSYWSMSKMRVSNWFRVVSSAVLAVKRDNDDYFSRHCGGMSKLLCGGRQYRGCHQEIREGHFGGLQA